jgi:formylmethanofuran dehydrogenase subunit E
MSVDQIAVEGQEAAWELYQLIQQTDYDDLPGVQTLNKWQSLALKAAGMDECQRCGDATARTELQANRKEWDEPVCNHCAGGIETERMSPQERRGYIRALRDGVD